MKFRLSLRAAHFINHPDYEKREVHQIMKKAYDLRSAVVHGGEPKGTSLPGGSAVNLKQFSDVLEELMRLAICRAVGMKGEANRLRQPAFWETSLFPE